MSKWIPVLVVDDDELVRRALKRSLQLYGFRVYLSPDGRTGLKLAREKKLSLILLDWMMPGVDGLEVLAELKHDEQTEHIPVFMLTGRGMMGDLNQAFEIGADGYITKPSDLDELARIVKAKWERYEKAAPVG